MNDRHPENSQPCESHGPRVSALIDGELETPDVLAVVDHLVECPHCRAFYHRVRKLGEMTLSSGAPSQEAPPEEIWRRIASLSGIDGTAAESSAVEAATPHRGSVMGLSPGVRRWAPRLAALLVLGLGLWLVQYGPRPHGPADEGQVLVTLEEDRGGMTDERFMRLAAEVLRADRSYHRKMLQVMRVAAAGGPPTEGTVDHADDRSWRLDDNGDRISLGEDDHLGDREGFIWRGQQL